jgi:hypothetical protein
MYPLFTEHP